MIDVIAQDYENIAFVAVAGRSSESESAERAPQWFDESRIRWGYSDDVWRQYEVLGQPTVFLISSDDVVLGQWFGQQPESVIRDALDQMVAIG